MGKKLPFFRYVTILNGMYCFSTPTAEGPVFPQGQVWINEYCSILTIPEYDANTGFFADQHINFMPVPQGMFTVAGFKDPRGNTLGWTFDWENSQLDACAVISWSGQMLHLPTGDPVILTTWVVTRQTSFEDLWTSTLIGQDQFYPIDSLPVKGLRIIILSIKARRIPNVAKTTDTRLELL